MFSKVKWHQGEKWEIFLKLYDEITQPPMFEKSKFIPTKFGDTQVHTSGNSDNPPLVFLHGIASCSVMFGDWLFPHFSKDYYCIAVDTMGDLGRSLPRDGDPENGIHDESEAAEWLSEVLDGLSIQQPVSIIGYSFGCFLSTCFARRYPDRVHKLVLMAPACVFAPISKWWLFQAIVFGVASKLLPQSASAMGGALHKWFFGAMVVNYEDVHNMEYPDLLHASQNLDGPQVPMQPAELDVPTLTKMNETCPTLLIIGKQECVIDPQVAVANAKQAKIQVVEYEKASHMFPYEHPRERAVDDALVFLSS